ncbi:MAG: electron transport complex subunit RsxA [Gammaproteobacteria bacterium]|jgi:Na+-translocating ferredoxin:NAD+ oxidoreductase subunit A|nr:electron transport complex subunit RsxA [Gammaproteobacteria bacterium]MBU0769909.1 electron transport complex subunit RsxA [Gammaproteobacteria bacterium]MBU0856286.1 electron transport complex subunit RsxA [Gammaproteobacteria bacterium]MBU1847761.1 electron transport complex subunit RsxA [Gammaproteobacteria bacterium]
MQEAILAVISIVLVNNVVLVRFLGLCPFMGVSRKIDSALGMGLATTFVMTLSSMASWLLEYGLLRPFGLGYLRILACIVVIAAVVQFVEMVIRKTTPDLHRVLGIYLPLITTNCAVLGIPLLNAQSGLGVGMSVLTGFSSGVGFTLVMILFAGLRERLELVRVPATFSGAPIAYITASLLALAFMGFAGLVPAGGH